MKLLIAYVCILSIMMCLLTGRVLINSWELKANEQEHAQFDDDYIRLSDKIYDLEEHVHE